MGSEPTAHQLLSLLSPHLSADLFFKAEYQFLLLLIISRFRHVIRIGTCRSRLSFYLKIHGPLKLEVLHLPEDPWPVETRGHHILPEDPWPVETRGRRILPKDPWLVETPGHHILPKDPWPGRDSRSTHFT